MTGNFRFRVIAHAVACFAPLTLCGCMTYCTCGKAKMDSEGIPSQHVERPGFYALVPVTFAGDVVTFPFQAWWHFAYKDTEYDPWNGMFK